MEITMAARILTTEIYNARANDVRPGEPIDDDMARTIASWWHSSGCGPITALSHGQSFSASELSEAVDIELNNARVSGQHAPEDLDRLGKLRKWADSLYVIAVWSSFGHTFSDQDGGVSCMSCGGVWTVMHDDADDLTHGAYVAANGDEASECPGHSVTHAEQDCDDCEDSTCEACAFDECNCLYCR